MKQYSRVSYGVRCQIYALKQAQIPIPEIARQLGFHKTTIYRELRRNALRGYFPKSADQRAKRRYQSCRKSRVITADLERRIAQGLREKLSPEQVSGRLRLESGAGPCHQTIYNFVKKHRGLYVLLRRFNKRGAGRYRQRSRLRKTHLLSIHARPSIANDRGRIGDWERDTMQTLKRGHLLVCTDRKSRFTKIGVVGVQTNKEINRLTMDLLCATDKKIRTMTNDNGKEFRANQDWGTRTYFCDPYKPQQRGTVENTIGLLRQYVPRWLDTRKWTKKQTNMLESKLNSRPRKVLGYKTPYEVYFNKKVALACLI